jgi:hypothetical protein
MAISVGISRIVVLTDYPEDGTGLLSNAKISLVRLDADKLKPWISQLYHDSNSNSNPAK